MYFACHLSFWPHRTGLAKHTPGRPLPASSSQGMHALHVAAGNTACQHFPRRAADVAGVNMVGQQQLKHKGLLKCPTCDWCTAAPCPVAA